MPVGLQQYAEGVLEGFPYGATRATDWIPLVLCDACQGFNLGTYVLCQFCRAPAYRGGLVPRTTGAPVVIVESKLNERISEVRAALAGAAGQLRNSRVADDFGRVCADADE